MPNKATGLALLFAAAILAAGCATSTPAPDSAEPLVGAWRSRIQFSSGDFAPVKDLEFLCVFNRGGTMTESSNYDSAPPVPPAYGVWRSTPRNLLADGKTSHDMHETFRALHQQIRCNADEQAADAVLELAK